MSEITKTWSEWLKNSRFSYMSDEQKEQTFRWLFQVRDKILDRVNIQAGDTLIDIGAGTGLLAFRAHEVLNGTGTVIISDRFTDCLDECRKIAQACDINEGIEFLQLDASNISLPDSSVNAVVMRSVLVHIPEKLPAIKEFYRILAPGGRISIYEPVIKSNTKYYELVNPENISNYEKIKEIEAGFMSDDNDPLTNFDDKTLVDDFTNAGFKNINLDLVTEKSTYTAKADMVDPWFNTPAGSGNMTMKQRFLQYLSEEEVNNFIEEVKKDLDNKEITLSSFSAYISAEK